jgi:hypothetical protein
MASVASVLRRLQEGHLVRATLLAELADSAKLVVASGWRLA